MTDDEQQRYALAEAQSTLHDLSSVPEGSFLLIAIVGKRKAKKIMFGSDSEHLLAELGKMSRHLERAIDEGQVNQAEDASWAPN